MRVIYIAGYARIGSTLLDAALGSHPDIFSAGELTHLFDDAISGAPCGCGKPLTACPIWGAVLKEIEVDFAHGAQLTRRCEQVPHVLRTSPDTCLEYNEVWSRIISSVKKQTGKSVLIDASKSMQFAARRVSLLNELAPHSLAVLHLTRDPRASVWSVRKGGNPIASGRRFKSLTPWRTAATWTAANIVAERSSRKVPSAHVRYEDLVHDPRSALARMAPLTSVPLESVAELLDAGRPLPTGHGISGNRLRQSGPIRLRADNDWETSASRTALAAAMLTFPIARRYGYEVA